MIPRGNVTKGYEAGATFNYYFFGQNLKIQADYAALINGAFVKGNGVLRGRERTRQHRHDGRCPGFIQGQLDHG